MNLQDFIQSMSNTAASNVSAPVDGINWLLGKAGLPVSSTPFMGSDWMEQKGLTRPVEQSASSLAGETAGMVFPMVAAAKAPQIAKGLLQMGENAMAPQQLSKQAGAVLTDYRGGHTAPMKDRGNAPLHDLTQTYPDDIYSSKAAQYYGHYGGGDMQDQIAINLMQQAKGKPNMPVTMYRAVPYEKTLAQQAAEIEKQMAAYQRRGNVPKGAALSGSDWYENASNMRDRLLQKAATQDAPERMLINNGDWVTLSKQYAKEHGEGALNGNFKILSKKVPARKLFTDGNSIHEFGYDESGRVSADLMNIIAAGGAGGLLGYNLAKE
jgi:hypothetical protein